MCSKPEKDKIAERGAEIQMRGLGIKPPAKQGPDLGMIPLDPNDPGNQANPFLLNQSLSRLLIGTPEGTSVGSLKNPNPFAMPPGLVPKIGNR